MLNQVLVQNSGDVGGSGGNGAFNSPDDVPEGVIAFFPANGGSSIDISDGTNNKIEGQGDIIAALGTSEEPIISNILHSGHLDVYSKAYSAPSKQKVTLAPETQSEDKVGLGFKITNLEQGYEPFPRNTFDVRVKSTDTAVDIVNKLIDAVLDFPASMVNGEGGPTVYAGSDLVLQFALADGGGSGGGITIDGDIYAATWDTDAATTAANFVSQHGDAIMDSHGIKVTVDNSDNLDLAFVNSSLDNGDVTATNGDVDYTKTEQTAKSLLVLEAKEYGQFFEVGYVGDWDPTITQTASYAEGTGTYDQVLEMEKSVFGFRGRYVQDDGILGRQDDPTTFADKSTNYDLIILRQKTDNDRAINKQSELQDIVLALATGIDKTDVNSFFGNQGVSL